MIFLYIDDIKKIKAKNRKQLITLVESCLTEAEIINGQTSLYIGIHGHYNIVLVKTPYKSELRGRFTNPDLLFPFYKSILP